MKIMRAALALLSAVLVLGPLALSGSAQPLCLGVRKSGAWTTIDAPDFESGPGGLTSYAVDPLSSSVIFATNGNSVMASIDGGCTWEPRFSLRLLRELDVPIPAVNSTIEQIEIPEHSAAHDDVFLLVAERVGPLTRPHVVVSRDGGHTWANAETGLPPATGDVLGLHVAPDSPNFVYLHSRLPTGNDEVYATTDGGRTWERRSNPNDGVFASDMTVDPQNSNELWFWGGSGLYHSTNGGRSRAHINRVGSPVTHVDVFHGPGAPARIMAFEAETSSFSVSLDGGRTWTPMGAPLTGNALSITHGNTSADVVFSMHQGVYRLREGGTWLDISPAGDKDILDLSATRTRTPDILGRTSSTIEKFTGLHAAVNLDPLDITTPTIESGVPTLSPKRVKLKLKHDQARKVTFTLDLPPQPNPVDVFFLVDTSKSMDASIAGLRTGMQKIITDLTAAGIDVQFGVGEFKDYPIPGYGDAQQGDFPYRLNAKIGADGPTLVAALKRLESSGGGALDAPESQLTGLYQAATGEGDPGFVPEGHDAGFRDQALPVIVHITDAPFHKEPQHPSPPFDVTATALRDRGILQVGLSVFGPEGDKGTPDLIAMARDTNTVAPVGVDCDANGSVDIPAGEPLVCDVTDSDYDGRLNLAPAIVATLKAVTKEVSVSLVPRAPEIASKLIRSVSPQTVAAVDLKDRHSLSFDVTFACPDALLDSKHRMSFKALVSDEIVAGSRVDIVCKPLLLGKRERKKLEVPPLLLAQAGVLPAALLALPAPPPPVIENIPASQSAAQAQGAMATEEQEELQVAIARQRSTFSSAREEVYEMSSYSEKKKAVPVALYVSAGAMALAYGLMVGARNRVRHAVAPARRKR